MKSKKTKGFTLIELLIVVCVIAILGVVIAGAIEDNNRSGSQINSPTSIECPQ